jgi:alpha-D-ribose 1-methylphosphonate 5-triphosphate synthase subunit PhnH
MIKETKYDHIFDSQEIFRKVLDSMARPGKINQLVHEGISVPDGLNKASALLGFSLLNSDVNFYMHHEGQTPAEYIRLNTASEQTGLSAADFVFINGRHDSLLVREIKSGEPETPQDGATLIIDVEKIFDRPTDQTHELILKGPGVKETKTIYIRGIDPGLFSEIKEKNSEYPLGIDTILTDNEGNVICLPRTNQFSWN